MKLSALVLVPFVVEVAGNGFRGSLSVSDVVERPRGFADADPGEDESVKVLQKNKLHDRHGDHRTLQKASGGAFSRDIQHQVEQMVSRVKHLHNRETSIEFANELTALEEELANTADKALVEEVNDVRADLCTQPAFEDTPIANCESFMEKSCSKRPLMVSSRFCTKFLRQRKHGGSHAPAEDNAVKFTVNNAADASTDGVAVASEGAMATEDGLDSESAAAAPGPAAGPGPAPGPVPMGVIFGGKADRPLPEQGFDGDLARYQDFEAQTANWQMEFGPKSGHRDFAVICADHKGNEWCRLHGYYGKKKVITKTIIEEIIEVVHPPPAPPPPPPAPAPPPPAPEKKKKTIMEDIFDGGAFRGSAARNNHAVAFISTFLVALVSVWA